MSTSAIGTEGTELTEALERAQRFRRLALLFQPPREGLERDLLAFFPEARPDQGEYHGLLGPGGVCPATETAYAMGAAPVLADVAAFYRAFSYAHPEVQEAPDHIAVELGFLSFLAMKEAYAAYRGALDALAIVRGAARKFALEHLGRWAGAFFDRLHAAAGGGFYAEAAEAARRELGLLLGGGA